MCDYEMLAIVESHREQRRRELVEALRRVDRAIADWLRWMNRRRQQWT